MDNKQIARILRETAQLLEIDGAIIGRYRSYEKAAELIDSLPESIEQLVKEPEKLKELPGIGDRMVEHLQEIVKQRDHWRSRSSCHPCRWPHVAEARGRARPAHPCISRHRSNAGARRKQGQLHPGERIAGRRSNARKRKLRRCAALFYGVKRAQR